MKRKLKKIDVGSCWHYDSTGKRIEGVPDCIKGDLAGVCGNLTGIRGDLYGV